MTSLFWVVRMCAVVMLLALGAAPTATAVASCGCRAGVDNICLYGPTDGCEPTAPGGYCDPNGDGDFSDADWVRGWVAFQTECAGMSPTECECRTDTDNFCLYGPTAACAMTQPGGYCDPDGNGDFGDADWVRGWIDFHDRCADVPPGNGECTCRDDVDNFCLYGSTAGCAMTQAGGYCDPNGDGNFGDADWVRGWTEFHDRCVTPPSTSPTPTPTPTPSGGTRPRRIGIEGEVCLYYDVRSAAWAVQEGGRIINNGTTLDTIVMRLRAEATEPVFGEPLTGPVLVTGFILSPLPSHFALNAPFGFHSDVPQPAPLKDSDAVLLVSIESRITREYTDFVSFGRIADHFPAPTFTSCVVASPTRAP